MGTNIYPAALTLPANPTPLVKEINADASLGRYLPTPTNDGSYIRLPTDETGNLELYNAANAQVWVKAHTDIHADAEYWTGVFWIDTTDEKIWVWVYDEGTEPDTYYLATVALSDGTVASIGSCEPGNGLYGKIFTSYYAERAAMGSGNLVIRDGDNQITLDTSDGSIAVATAQITQNGAAISGAADYETEDGLIYVITGPVLSVFPISSGQNSYMQLQRGGSIRYVYIPMNSPGGVGGYPILWGGYVAICSASTDQAYNARFFERAAFDTWLKNLCDYYGLPE